MDAEDTLVYYFRTLFQKTGLPWSADNDTEVRGIVKDIIAEAVNQGPHGWRDNR